jgi:hypothetical protein
MAPTIVTKWAEYCEANYSRELPENRQLREVIKRVRESLVRKWRISILRHHVDQ